MEMRKQSKDSAFAAALQLRAGWLGLAITRSLGSCLHPRKSLR